jgi:hypothetical protein
MKANGDFSFRFSNSTDIIVDPLLSNEKLNFITTIIVYESLHYL